MKSRRKYSTTSLIEEDEPGKDIANKKKLEAIKKNPLAYRYSGKIVSLAYIFFSFELMLQAWWSNLFQHVCYEKEASHHLKMKDKIKIDNLKNIKVWHREVVDYIKHAVESDCVFLDLDYMSEFWTIYLEVYMAIKRKIIKIGCPMSITMSQGSRKLNPLTEEFLKKNPMSEEDRIKGVTVSEHIFKTWLIQSIGDNYVIEEFYSYNNGKKDDNGKLIRQNYQMMIAIIRRVK
jgi:hypothetical protein